MSHLQVTLDAPEEAVAGERVAFAVVISNRGGEPVDLHLQGREPTFDLRVADEAGGTVWRRLEGQTVQAILRIDTLDPGASMTLGDVWDQHDDGGRDVPPGSYFLQAEVLTDGKPLVSQAKKLRVTKG